MREFNLNIIALDLDRNLEKLSQEATETLNAAIEGLAHAAYARIIAKAQRDLNETRADYLKDLSFTKNSELDYTIQLKDNSFGEDLEVGFGAYTLNDKQLNSDTKVSAGPNIGKRWVREGANGKYANVPISYKPYSRIPKNQNINNEIRRMQAFNAQGLQQRITQIFRDVNDNMVEGKAATAKSSNSKLNNLVKFQNIYTRDKVDRAESLYMTFRTMSENGKMWTHPGFKGLKAFDETEMWVESEIKKILGSLE